MQQRQSQWTAQIELAELGHESLRFDYGGLDMQLVVQRYPERVEVLELTLETADQSCGEGQAAYFVKAIQCDGQMAWSSPVYVLGRGGHSLCENEFVVPDGILGMNKKHLIEAE